MKNTNKKRIFWTQISRPKPLNFVILVFKKNDFPFSCFKMLLVIPYKEENGSKEKNANGTPVQKYRDLLKSAAIMSDGQTNYLLLGIENQSEIHYAMPVRNALYDALQYSRQIEDTAARHLQHNAADVIRTCTGIYFPLEETQEVIDVCKAIQEMKEDSRSEGMLTHARKTALNLWNSGMPLAQIADMVEYPADQVQQWLQEAGKC